MKHTKKSNKKTIFQEFGSSPKALANTTPTSRSKTGVRGVYLTGGNPKKGRFYFQARVTVPGTHKEIVVYNGRDFKKACAARKKAEQIYYQPVIDEAKKMGYLKGGK